MDRQLGRILIESGMISETDLFHIFLEMLGARPDVIAVTGDLVLGMARNCGAVAFVTDGCVRENVTGGRWRRSSPSA